jgi:ADP-ribosylation factor-binding protein GGA
MTLFLLPRPPLATRLLAHKIQSPQEWEAIQALTVRKDPGVS